MKVINKPASFFESFRTLSPINNLCASDIRQSLLEKLGESGSGI